MNPDAPHRPGRSADPSAPEAPREIELKLLLEPSDVPALRRNLRLRELAVTRSLHTRYFDTEGLDLLRRGVTLRVRRDGRRHVQAVKLPSGGGSGLLERVEIETPLEGDVPAPERVDPPALRELLTALAESPGFGPILETRVQRTSRRLRLQETTLDLDLDEGEIRTPRGTAPICELELELVSGEPHRLYELARELRRSVALRVSTRSKHARGIELLTGAVPAPRRARRLRLPRKATLEQALEAALRSAFDQILANEEPARRGVDPEGVHQLRVGVRRLRSAMTLFRDVLPSDRVRTLRDELRWLGAELGDARDFDVFVDALSEIRRRFPDDPDLKRLHDEAGVVRAEAYDRARRCLDSPRYAELVLTLGHWITARAWREQPLRPASARLFLPAHETAAGLLRRRYRRLRRRARDLARGGGRERHALRIEAKKLRYASEFLRSCFPGKRAGRFIAALSRLQETLGHLNDAALARRLLGRLLARLGGEATPELQRAAGFVVGWTARDTEAELAELPARWKSLRRRSPL